MKTLKLIVLLNLGIVSHAQIAAVSNVSVAFSSAPIFTANAPNTNFDITLTGNMSSSTFVLTPVSTAPTVGSLRVCQDSTGGRTFVAPAGSVGFGPIDTTASKCSTATWKYDGTLRATGPFVKDDGTVIGGGGGGGVSSVGLTLPAPFNVSGQPVTSSGTIAGTWSVSGADYLLTSSASNTAGFTGPVANCVAAGGVIQYATSTHSFSCHALIAGDIPNIAQSQVTSLVGDLALLAPKASPALTGVPTVPTAAADTNTTQAASAAFVLGQAGSATPVMDSTGAAGTSLRYARQDHVHPTDTSRAPLIGPAFTAPISVQNASAAYEGPVLGSELVSGSGWTSTNWTGSWLGGWTHTAGNVSALSFPISITAGHTYQLAFTIASETAGAVGISLGGVAGVNYSNGGLNVYGVNGTYYFGPTVSGTAALTFTPAFGGLFDGTLQSISVKEITGASTPSVTVKDSFGAASSEWRISVAALSNISVGSLAGRFLTPGAVNNNFFGGGSGTNATTGWSNNGYGHATLGLLTHGFNNSAFGEGAGYKIKSGYGNVCIGVDTCGFAQSGMTGYHNVASGNYAGNSLTTGFENTLNGPYAGYNLTTGSGVVAHGLLAGAYLADGATPNTDGTQSLYLGGLSKAKQAGGIDEIVIGYNATGHGSHTATYGSPSITDHYFPGVIHPDGISTGGSYSAGGPAVTLTTGVAASRPACSTSPIAYLATDTHALTVCNTTTTTWGAALNPTGSFGEIFNLGTGLWECYTDAAASCAPAGGGGGSGTGNPYIASFSCSTSPTSILQSTHLQGAYPYLRFTDSSNYQTMPGSMTLASNGDVTVTCGVSVTLKVYASGAVGAHPTIPQTFTSSSSIVVYGINHNFGSPYVKAQVWDNATPRNWIIPGTVTTDATTFNTTVTLSSAKTGLAIVAAN